MGYYKDEHLIMEAYSSELLEEFRSLFLDILKKKYDEEQQTYNYGNYVSGVLTPLAGGAILYIPSDNSKEGWTTSNIAEEAREEFINAITDHNAHNPAKRITVLKVTVEEYNDKPEAEWLVNDKN